MVKLSEISRQNPWWTQGSDFARNDYHLSRTDPIFFNRRSLDLKSGNIHILRGCRQVGKTTYLKKTINQLIAEGVSTNHILYLSLDLFTSRREMRNAINYFLDITRDVDKIYLFLDEITSIGDWNAEIKYLVDLGIVQKSVIITTGSSAAGLKEKADLLPGRGLEGNEYYFKPLNFREFVLQTIPFIIEHTSINELQNSLNNLLSTINKITIDLSKDFNLIKENIQDASLFKRELQMLLRMYLMTGGIPVVINHYLTQKYIDNNEHIDRFLAERYIRDVISDIYRMKKQETIARDILRGIVDKYGSRYSFQTLAKQIGQYHQISMDYLQFLEQSFILVVYYAYDFNTKRAKYKGDKKVYFLDPFIHHAINSYLSVREVWNVINEMLQNEGFYSSIIEGMVATHLLAHKEIPYLRNGQTFLWFYYDKQGKEIDNIIRCNHNYLGIEVKYQSHVDFRDIKKIQPLKE